MNTTTNRQPLTHIQGQVLAYMAKFLQLNDQLPPQLTIAAAFGWASPNAALDHLKALEKKGYLTRNEIGHLMLADRPAPHVVYINDDAMSPATLDQLRHHIRASRQPLLVVRQPEKEAAMVMLDALRAVASKLGSRPYGTGSYLPKPIRDQVLNAIQAATGQEVTHGCHCPALTGKQRLYLAQAWAMLENYAGGQRSVGNDSIAEGAMASAHVIKVMLAPGFEGQEVAHG